MKLPTKRKVIFHGEFSEKYSKTPIEVGADSMFTLCQILFKSIYPDLLEEKNFNIVLEDDSGNMTELFDPEQQLYNSQKTVHIMPNPDGAYGEIIYAIVIAIIAVGISLLLAPKVEAGNVTTAGANWETPENVVGQGGTIPVVLGKRLAGSRVASYGIDSVVYRGRAVDNA